MNQSILNNRTKRILFISPKIIPWVILAIQFLWIIVIFYQNGVHWLDSDMSAEMVLADTLNKQKEFILCSDWYYSTELRVLNSQLIYQIALLFFTDWHIARVFSMSALLCIYLSSYFFMSKQIGLKNNGIWGAILMMTPLSSSYVWHILVGNFYIMNMSIIFLSLGLFYRLYRGTKWYQGIIFWTLLLILAFVGGLGGVRLTTIFFLPLIATTTLFAFIKLASVKQKDFTWKIFNHPTYKLLAISVSAFIFNVIGYFVNSTILSKHYSFTSYNTVEAQPIDLSIIFTRLEHVLTLFGYQVGTEIISKQGIHILMSIICFLGLLLAYFVLAKSYKKLTKNQQFLFIFSIIMLLSSILVNSMTGQNLAAYYIPTFIFCLIIIGMTVSEIVNYNKVIQWGMFGILFFGMLTYYYKPTMAYKFAGVPDDHALYSESYKRYLASEWLVENEYTEGYGTFFNTSIFEEHSDGVIDMHGITYGHLENLYFHNWLQEKSNRDNPPKGKVFVILSQDENDLSPGFANEEHLAYNEHGYYIYTYDNIKDLFATTP